ncbi:hypothetical protein RFI_14596 [Reticulomyxa filosa]|uniref:Uncharacterized protein n=1 Tax=Reticulomyxa filosa TaxID=46433 RepID=X6N971_RETFI|nr:hypothetical protein RFI_14596 [Reticulomyxa filosa]|eukprot:ETO22601.1 hypothetical protein RFI_14596 [Reticulomyxa filosa]
MLNNTVTTKYSTFNEALQIKEPTKKKWQYGLIIVIVLATIAGIVMYFEGGHNKMTPAQTLKVEKEPMSMQYPEKAVFADFMPKSKSSDAYETAKEVAETAKEVKETAKEVADTIEEVEETVEDVEETIEDVIDTAEDVADTVEDVEETLESAGSDNENDYVSQYY